ncbi:MAG: efflux RND transporter periplasmic adaptor subunit [Nitrospirae bacterium]|nr:efflux RND transporter periplasmic adaptor subunit [Nitrospirota bacterium]
MKKRVAVGVVIIVIIISGAVASVRYYNHRANGGRITASGTIEATEVAIESKVTGRIERLLADEGDRVSGGQLLVQIETREIEAQVRGAEAQVEAARANLANLEAGSREQEIKKGEAALEEANANLEKTRTDRDRLDRLHNDKVVSDQEWERARTSYDVAVAKQREGREHLDLLKAGTRRQVIEAARGEFRRAQAALDLALAQLDNTRLTAPLASTVLLRNREPGELAMSGTPILTLGDLDHLWVSIYLKETDLGRIKLGGEARITVDSFPGKNYLGKVTHISNKAEFTPKTIQTKEERVKLVFEVKVAIENQNGELKPGLPADVELLIQEVKP